MYRTIGFIGGGQMAEAIIKGLIASGAFQPEQIQVAETIAQRRSYLADNYQVNVFADIQPVARAGSVILLAVKPQVMGSVLRQLKNMLSKHLIISVAAGIPLSFYTEHLDNPDLPVIRVMPNIPALVQDGTTAICRNKNVTDDDLAFALTLFNTIGITATVEESMMDAVTGLSGSGPAYLCAFAEALINGGVKVGLARDVSRKLVLHTIIGTARMLVETGHHPAEIRDRVTSPGGTAASGLQRLEEDGFGGTVAGAVEAAYLRSRELGKD